MRNSPFKFLDSYTKEDRDIFFGRDREIEELYQKVFESKILLVYGISGTGKTSLINCGLANKFNNSDWLPVNIRRGSDINENWRKNIEKNALSPIKTTDIKKSIKSIYLDHFRPVYFIFDQFEELFIFGSHEEKEEFIKNLKSIFATDIQCKFLFVLREEYLAGATEFEKEIPTFLSNRIRLEKMTRTNAKHAIEGPCRVHNIMLEENFADNLLAKLNPKTAEIELTYLQVFLDKIFRLSQSLKSGADNDVLSFSNAQLSQAGDVSDLLGNFLEEQVATLDDPDTGLIILKSFVSVKGTKRQISEEEVNDFARTLGKDIDYDKFKEYIQKFISIRILRDKDEHGRFELRHDALAAKIYEKITLVEKELMEVRQFLDDSYSNYLKRKTFLNTGDLSYIAPYENKMFLNAQLEDFIKLSKKEIQKARQRRIKMAIAAVIILLVIFSGFTLWALRERAKAIDQTKIAKVEQERAKTQELIANEKSKEASLQRNLAEKEKENAETQKSKALNAMTIAEVKKNEALEANAMAEREKQNALKAKEKAEEELFKSLVNSWTISVENLNFLYYGIDNPVNITASGFKSENLVVEAIGADIKGENGKYIINPNSDTTEIFLKGFTYNGIGIYLGSKKFINKRLPLPVASIAGMSISGRIDKSALLKNPIIKLTTNVEGTSFSVELEVASFDFITKKYTTMSEIDSLIEAKAIDPEIFEKVQKIKNEANFRRQEMKQEIDAMAKKMADETAELTKKANVSTGNAFADMAIKYAAEKGGGAIAYAAAEKKINAAKEQAFLSINNFIKQEMGKLFLNKTLHSDSNQLTEEMKREIEKILSGTQIVINNIKVKGFQRKEYDNIESIQLKIK